MADQVPSRPMIDTTPTFEQPPKRLVDTAEQDIPSIFANVPPTYDGTVELVAEALVFKLTKNGHTIAASQWAIHQAVVAGRLLPRAATITFPGIVTPNPSLHGPRFLFESGGTFDLVIPKDKPARFDQFKVAATPALTAWWHSIDSEQQSEPTQTERVQDDSQSALQVKQAPVPSLTPQKRQSRNGPSKDRQTDILTAIRSKKTPLMRDEIRDALRLKTEGKLGADLAWMVKNHVLINIPQRGYWPKDDPLPE